MIINVTTKDITEGNASYDACPITIALRRKFSNKVSVSRNFIRILKKRTAKEKFNLVPLPNVARAFLLDYYKWKPAEPFYFELSDKDVKALKG